MTMLASTRLLPPGSDGYGCRQDHSDPKPWVDLNDVRWEYENKPYDHYEPRAEYFTRPPSPRNWILIGMRSDFVDRDSRFDPVKKLEWWLRYATNPPAFNDGRGKWGEAAWPHAASVIRRLLTAARAHAAQV